MITNTKRTLAAIVTAGFTVGAFGALPANAQEQGAAAAAPRQGWYKVYTKQEDNAVLRYYFYSICFDVFILFKNSGC